MFTKIWKHSIVISSVVPPTDPCPPFHPSPTKAFLHLTSQIVLDTKNSTSSESKCLFFPQSWLPDLSDFS